MMDTVRAAGGRLFLWHGCALLVGPGIDSSPHAHYAVQLTFGVDRPFRARLDGDTAWTETRAAIFASSQPHQLDCSGGTLAHLFIEAPQHRRSIASQLQASFHAHHDFAAVAAAIDAIRDGGPEIDAAKAAARWLGCALPDHPAPSGFDARIARALALLDDNTGTPPGGGWLAAQVHLSESRFTHLFRQQTGLPLTRYLLWTRLLAAVAAVADGENMTNAAHRAGFADLAHMSRTFRNTFGVVPSELHKMTIAFKRNAQ